MNVIRLHHQRKIAQETGPLFARLEKSLKMAGADIDKSIRMATTLAPILRDKTSNERHLQAINSDASVQEKTIAILMLGFPNNREALPTLQNLLYDQTLVLRMASAIAIAQMRDGHHNSLLSEILTGALDLETSFEAKVALTRAFKLLQQK